MGLGRASLLAGALGLATSAHATVLVPADFVQLVREAQAVVHGRVARVAGVWADGRRRVDTVVTLDVIQYFKGDFGPTVTVRVPGGELGRYRSFVVGAPVFEPGDEVVLLLGARGPSVPYVLGLSQGVFRVVASPATGDKLVLPPPLVAGAEPETVRRGDPSRRPLPLARFGEAVRQAAGGAARGDLAGPRAAAREFGSAARRESVRRRPSGGGRP
jgi:hypothetical protein